MVPLRDEQPLLWEAVSDLFHQRLQIGLTPTQLSLSKERQVIQFLLSPQTWAFSLSASILAQARTIH